MSSVPFTLEASKVLDNTNVVSNGITNIYTGASQSNTGDYGGLKVIMEYSDLLPDPDIANSNYSLSCVVESQDDSGQHWYPLIRQFDVLRSLNQGARQVLIISPGIFTFDEGVPIDDWDGQKVTTRYNKKQDRLTDIWRVCVHVLENKFGDPDAFQSCKINLYGERFNA